MSAGISAPAFSWNQRAAPGCHFRTLFFVPMASGQRVSVRRGGMFTIPLVVRDITDIGFLHRQSFPAGRNWPQRKVPPSTQSAQGLQRGCRCPAATLERRHGVFRNDRRLLFLGELDDVHARRSALPTGDSGNRHTAKQRRRSLFQQAVLQLAAQVGPAAIAALEINAQRFPAYAGKIGVQRWTLPGPKDPELYFARPRHPGISETFRGDTRGRTAPSR